MDYGSVTAVGIVATATLSIVAMKWGFVPDVEITWRGIKWTMRKDKDKSD